LLTSAENITEDQFWRVISEGWKTDEELIETDTKCPPVNSSTFTYIHTQLSLLPSVGWEMSTSQSAVMLCGWGVKAGMVHSTCG